MTAAPRVYLPVIRNNVYDVFQLFDATDATVPSGDRATSTVATQALFALNSELMLEAAKALADEASRLSSRRPAAARPGCTCAAMGGRQPRMTDNVPRVSCPSSRSRCRPPGARG